jgi:uracil-DNA glycosylase
MGRPKGSSNRPKAADSTGDLFTLTTPRVPDPGVPRLQSADPDQWLVHPAWKGLLSAFFASHNGQQLLARLRQRLEAGATVYPSQPLRALQHLAAPDVRVLVLGQDPYHGPGQAEGLAFSVAPGAKLPPSLRNIFKEMQRDLGRPMPAHGSLMHWADQGVLLLNTCLTVEDGVPASHSKYGWQALTDLIVSEVAKASPACVYLLWGGHAQAMAETIRQVSGRHQRAALILQANHPSPLSAMRGPQPFMGCGHFGQAQAWLHAQGVPWRWT